MTAPRDLRGIDANPPQPWRETSQRGIRLMALQAVAEAVRRAKEKGGRA